MVVLLMYYKLIISSIILISIYTILPTLYNRFLNPNIIKAHHIDKIYLTFDDGPDSNYTNQLLDLLNKHNIKTTFFLVAKKTIDNKSIVQRIIDEGHSIGLHSYAHKNSWLMTPNQMKIDFQQALNILNEFGYRISLYRPPWGIFNLFTYHYAKSNNLKTILWTRSSKDWQEKTPVDYIVNNTIENIKPGDILLFHDSGGDKYAPQNTLLALEILIPVLLEKGYSFDKI